MISSFVSYSMLCASLCSCLLCSCGRHTLHRLLPFWVHFCTRSDTLLVPAIRAINRANWLPSINPNVRVIFLQIFPIWLLYRILLLLLVFPKYKYYPTHSAWSDKVILNQTTIFAKFAALWFDRQFYSPFQIFLRWLLILDLLIVIFCDLRFIGFNAFSRSRSRRQLKSSKSSIMRP